MTKPITLTAHLGTGEQGAARKAALVALAERGGHMYNGEPSIGRWLCALADEAGTKPEPRLLSNEAMYVVESARKDFYSLGMIEDAICIHRLRWMSRRLTVCGFRVTNGDTVGQTWTEYIKVHNPAAEPVEGTYDSYPDDLADVWADLSECRVLLDTVREMKDPSTAFARWRPKVKEVRS